MSKYIAVRLHMGTISIAEFDRLTPKQRARVIKKYNRIYGGK